MGFVCLYIAATPTLTRPMKNDEETQVGTMVYDWNNKKKL